MMIGSDLRYYQTKAKHFLSQLCFWYYLFTRADYNVVGYLTSIIKKQYFLHSALFVSIITIKENIVLHLNANHIGIHLAKI